MSFWAGGLIDPAVGARGGLVLFGAHVDFEFFAVALDLPVGEAVAHAIEEGAAAQVEPADEHAAEVADVADLVGAETEGAEKGEGGQDDHRRAHADADGQGEENDLAVGEENGHGHQNSEDGSGGADSGDVGEALTPEDGSGLDQDVDEARANAGEEVILQETRLAPNQFELAAEHPEQEHVHADVPDGARVMEKEIGERLPDAQAGDDGGGDEAEPGEQALVGEGPPEVIQENLKEKDGEVGDEQELHAGRHVEIKADAVVADAGARAHKHSSVRRRRALVKESLEAVEKVELSF